MGAQSGNGDLEFADSLWKTANKLRGSVESAEYKHIVLGLLFLKYISDAFEERRDFLMWETNDPESEYYTASDDERGYIIEDKDEYIGARVFWVPKEARWSYLQANAAQPNIGKLIDDAMIAIERENPKQLKGVLPKIYARSPIPAHTLGELINLFAAIGFGTKEAIAKDILGRTYEYFIKMFAKAEGHRGGEFYTPNCVVRLIVEMLEPYEGRIYDPACGSGGMFVQSKKFIDANNSHGGKGISIYGQEYNIATWRICKMNLAIRGMEGNIALGNTFHNDKHRDLRADFIMTNPPFNMKDWGADRVQGDVRLKYGIPPNSNANYMWIQHFIHHLAPNGIAGFVMANGSLSVGGVEGKIRKKIIEDDMVDCVIACPPQLFFTTQIPVSIWFVTKNKSNGKFRDRSGETLFIDARKLYTKISRVQNEFTEEHIRKIADTYHAWRGEEGPPPYKDVKGFCKSATLEEIRSHGYVLTPGRYVGIEKQEDDGEPFNEKMERLTAELQEQFEKSRELEEKIKANLGELGYGL